MGHSACSSNRKPVVVDFVKVVMSENEISEQKLNILAAGTA